MKAADIDSRLLKINVPGPCFCLEDEIDNSDLDQDRKSGHDIGRAETGGPFEVQIIDDDAVDRKQDDKNQQDFSIMLFHIAYHHVPMFTQHSGNIIWISVYSQSCEYFDRPHLR